MIRTFPTPAYEPCEQSGAVGRWRYSGETEKLPRKERGQTSLPMHAASLKRIKGESIREKKRGIDFETQDEEKKGGGGVFC